MHATTLLAPFELPPCQCRRPVMKYRTAVKRHTWVPKEKMLRNTRDASSKVYQTKAKVYQDLKRKRKSAKVETFFSSVKQPSIVKKLSMTIPRPKAASPSAQWNLSEELFEHVSKLVQYFSALYEVSLSESRRRCLWPTSIIHRLRIQRRKHGRWLRDVGQLSPCLSRCIAQASAELFSCRSKEGSQWDRDVIRCQDAETAENGSQGIPYVELGGESPIRTGEGKLGSERRKCLSYPISFLT
jgi:hypothetical protein